MEGAGLCLPPRSLFEKTGKKPGSGSFFGIPWPIVTEPGQDNELVLNSYRRPEFVESNIISVFLILIPDNDEVLDLRQFASISLGKRPNRERLEVFNVVVKHFMFRTSVHVRPLGQRSRVF